MGADVALGQRKAHDALMLFGGAFFNPNARSGWRTSISGLLSNLGILLGSLTMLAGVLLPWVHRAFVGSAYAPPNGIAAAGGLGWLLAVTAGLLFLGAMSGIISSSRPFTFGMQLFAIVGGTAALVAHAFARPCFGMPPEQIEHRISFPFGPVCWTGDGLGAGYYLVRAGAVITIASAVFALAIAGVATAIRRRRAPAVA
jgi:hypothetical protein